MTRGASSDEIVFAFDAFCVPRIDSVVLPLSRLKMSMLAVILTRPAMLNTLSTRKSTVWNRGRRTSPVLSSLTPAWPPPNGRLGLVTVRMNG